MSSKFKVGDKVITNNNCQLGSGKVYEVLSVHDFDQTIRAANEEMGGIGSLWLRWESVDLYEGGGGSKSPAKFKVGDTVVSKEMPRSEFLIPMEAGIIGKVKEVCQSEESIKVRFHITPGAGSWETWARMDFVELYERSDSDFDDYLKSEGQLEEATKVATERTDRFADPLNFGLDDDAIVESHHRTVYSIEGWDESSDMDLPDLAAELLGNQISQIDDSTLPLLPNALRKLADFIEGEISDAVQ